MVYKRHGRNISKETQEKIVDLYQSGKSNNEICSMYNISNETVSRYLAEYGVCVKRSFQKISDYEINEFVDMYLNKKMSIKEIEAKTKHSRHTITKYLNAYLSQHNLERRYDAPRTYQLNEQFFDTIDSHDKAYILGFMYSDGCNMKNKGTVAISLEEHDKYILEKMRIVMESTRPLSFVDNSNKRNYNNPKNYQYKDMWKLVLFSAHMCNSLEENGAMPSKSLKIEFPKWLDEKYYSSFMRGVFDGDGYISNPSKLIEISITSTESFLTYVLNYLISHNIIKRGNIRDASCHNSITRVLEFGGYANVISFCNWIYSDISSDLYLTRKHDRYLTILNNYNKKVA